MSPDSSLAVDLNPAGLATLDTWSLTVSHIEPLARSVYPDRVTSGFFGFKLGDAFALGTGFDVVRSRTTSLPSSRAFLLGAALSTEPWWSLGTTWRVRGTPSDGSTLHSADVSLAVWPSPYLGFSLMGRDLSAQPLHLGALTVYRSGVFAAVVRPLLDDRLWIEAGGVRAQHGDLGVRVAGSVPVPWLGRAAIAAEQIDVAGKQGFTLTAGLDVRLGGLSVAPALSHAHDEFGWSILGEVHGHPRPGLPAPKYVARISLESLGTRRLLSAQRKLHSVLHDPAVSGVVLMPRETGIGLAGAQELRLLISELQRAGKPVSCHLESPSGSEYYLCAGADRVTLDPAGNIRLMGLSAESLYLGALLRDFGVRADFVRIGEFKSAPEQFTNSQSSEPAREQRKALLDDGYARLLADLAKDLSLNEQEVAGLLDKGPFAADEALSSGLVSATIDEQDLPSDVEQLFGRASVTKLRPRSHPERFGPTGQIGVVVVDGTIVDGENVDVPFFDVHMSGGRTISKTLDDLADDPRIRAIVVRIDSPGGAVTASDQIWRAVDRARTKKPVIASMGDVAASGGYYAAAAATEIWAAPSTITGSIGVFYGKVDIAPLVERYGVHIETDKRGAHAGADSLFRPFTDEERAALTEKLRIWYRKFISRVSAGRHMKPERVDELARGRVYSGDAAQRIGLVDSLGGFDAALARARQLAHLPDDAEVVILPERPSTLLDYVRSGRAEAKADPTLALFPVNLRAVLARIALLSQLAATEPVALFEGPTRLE